MVVKNKLSAAQYQDIWFQSIDLLCGAGGATAGMEDARDEYKNKICDTIACINHWPTAIKTHKANHPHIKHFLEDIIGFDVTKFPPWAVEAYKVLFAGIECTNHSIAKGGISRDAESRTMAMHLEPYVAYLNLDYIVIENVKEFRIWGPLHEKVVMQKGKKKITLKDPIPKKTELLFYQEKVEEGYVCLCPLEKIKATNEKGKKVTVGLGPCWIPVHSKKGIDYMKWKKMMESYGYWSQERIINAADHGARTIRKRLFIVFAKHGLPIEWPKPTHNKKGTNGLRKWLPVKPVLDLQDEGHSIFDRRNNLAIQKQHRKDLKEPSLERVYNGLLKHVVGASEDEFIYKAMGNQMDGTKSNGKSVNEPSLAITTHDRLGICKVIREDAFLMKWIGDRKEDIEKYCHRSIKDPAPTVVCQNRLGIVKACREPDKEKQGELFDDSFLVSYHGNGDNTKGVNEPANAIPGADVTAKVQVNKANEFLMSYHYKDKGRGVDEPAQSIVAADKLAKVKVDSKAFIVKNFSGKPKYKNSSVDEPIGAITTADHNSIVNSKSFINLEYSSGGQNQSIDDPSAAVLQNPKQKLVNAYILDGNYMNTGKSIEEPAPTILASRHHHYLVNPQYSSKGGSVDDPCFTIIARTDKKPPYLVNIETGIPHIIVYEDDSPMTKKLKILMATYGIVDIKMRMLKVKELLAIQDFRADTKMYGNQTEQKKQIGNAVVRRVAKRITESLHKGLTKHIAALRKAA